MIKNERQYLITKSKYEQFTSQLTLEEHTGDSVSLANTLKINALKSLIQELRQEIKEYELLKESAVIKFAINSFDEIPEVLIKARINSGLSQKALADQLGLKEQQIQKYESTDYDGASLARIREVARVLNIKMNDNVQAHQSSPKFSADNLIKRLVDIGLNKKFILRKLILNADLEAFKEENLSNSKTFEVPILRASSAISRLFDWHPMTIFGNEPLNLELARVGTARFKAAVNAESAFLNAYSLYANYLARLTLSSLSKIDIKKIPSDAFEIRKILLKRDPSLSFDSILSFVWECGIPVLPLKDDGAFKGASWRINGNNIIVLKQGGDFEDRWTWILLHELFHVFQEPEKSERSVIEDEEIAMFRKYSDEEDDANSFASDVLLGKEAEGIVDECISESKGDVKYLRNAAMKISSRRNINVGHLADYLAFRLNMQNINWWGAATNLQSRKGDPWEKSRDYLIPRLELDSLNPVDRELLLKALS